MVVFDSHVTLQQSLFPLQKIKITKWVPSVKPRLVLVLVALYYGNQDKFRQLWTT